MAGSIIPALSDMFPDVVTVRHITGKDGFGRVQGTGSASTIPCKIRATRQMVTSEAGDQRKATLRLVTAGYFALVETDQFTLPAAYGPSPKSPLSVDTKHDENGPHHQTVYF